MLNGIGIQNPGIAAWVGEFGPQLSDVPTNIFGSAVGTSADEFADVAAGFESAGVAAVEVNLSCPNLEGGGMFALDASASAAVIDAVRARVSIPVGAKLSPNAIDIAGIAGAVHDAGADWVVLTNTVWGAGIDVKSRRPLLSGVVGGYSGPPLKPIALRCVIEVREAHPGLPIVGCGGVATGLDVVEYLLAGAQAVAVGSAHFANPRVGQQIIRQLDRFCRKEGITNMSDLIGKMERW
jgi:dihydroorotate dehydrogenase (NAD+) catalytic subunit